jgi:hypothetical protein
VSPARSNTVAPLVISTEGGGADRDPITNESSNQEQLAGAPEKQVAGTFFLEENNQLKK